MQTTSTTPRFAALCGILLCLLCLPLQAQAQRGALSLRGQGFARAADNPALDLGNESLTVEAWIKHDGTSAANAVILTKSVGNTIDYELSLAGSGEEVPVRFYIYSNNYFAESTEGIPANQWTHVAGTYDGTTIAVYVNGELSGTRNTSGLSNANNGPLVLGANTAGSARFFSGQIDEVRIWSSARSMIELRGNLFSAVNATLPDLRAYYSFSGAPVDLKGTNNLNLVGDASIVAPGIFPAAPNLFAMAGNAQVRLQWNQLLGALNAPVASQFRLYRSTTADRSDRQLVTTLNAGTTSYTDTGLNNGTLYFYEITAIDATGSESDYSVAATATPYNTGGGGSLSLGGQGYARASDRPSLDLGNEAITVEAWVRHDGRSAANAIILTKREGNTIDYELSLVGSGEEVPVRFYIYSNNYFATSTEGIPANQWTHVAGTYDGTTIAVYVNGELSGARNTSGLSNDNNGPLAIGANSAGNAQFFSGQIDEVRIWSTARALFEIQQNMAGLLTGSEEGLAAYFRFDDVGATAPRGTQTGSGSLVLTGDAAIVASGVSPLPPRLFATPGDGSALLRWTDEHSSSQFRVYRSTRADRSDRQLVTTLAAGTTSYTDAGLNNGVTYFYEITSASAGGQASAFSHIATVTPGANLQEHSNALALDGAGDYALVTDRPTLDIGTESLAVEAWIRHDGQSNANAVILTKSEGSTIDYELSLFGSGEAVPVRFYIYSTNYFATSSVNIPANQWTHVAGTYDGTVISIYVNGELSGTRNTSGETNENNGPLVFGANSAGNARFFSGQIDEVRIWGTARSIFEIQQNRSRELAGNEEGLLAYFRFDETSGTVSRGAVSSAMTASLHGNARLTGTPSTVAVEAGDLPRQFVLEGNYPNPFNPQTTIRFGLDQSAVVRLRVFDVTGREVAVLVRDEAYAPGWHEVTFHAAGLPSGLYLYRVEAGAASATGRMVLVK